MYIETYLIRYKKKKPQNQLIMRIFLYSERDLNPHGHNGHWILSPTCLPIPPPEPIGLPICLDAIKPQF